ncbi:hypothetical protein OVA14_05510 [Agrococcus sp. SL85]|uniref:hypothetical protein n=1 Tax=Agrococcus sp. SL85 TaxID=2995141 RepID=UPI00226CB911|nr:hypothetical protein [Agrococcus sp. SL85]WAC67200.1 hypothetical protein OVA14_05510 [Agrococcus sp. SL85]
MTNRIAPRRWGAALAALASVALLAGCATSAPGTGSASAPPAPLGETRTVTTANGTASFEVPVAWEVVDLGFESASQAGEASWTNGYDLLGAGIPLFYSDGPPSDVRSFASEGDWGEVDRRDLGRGLLAMAYWQGAPGHFEPRLDLVHAGNGRLDHPARMGADEMEVRFVSEWTDERGERLSFETEAEAVEALEAPEVQRALDVMATLQLHGPSYLALPEGVGPQPAADEPASFTAASGAITLTVQPGWTVRDESWQDAAGADWTMVTLLGPDGAMLQYVEEPAYASASRPGPDADRQVRATTVDGYEVVAARERSGDDPDAPYVVHLSLAEPAGGGAQPLCDDRCVSFAGGLGAQVADAAEADALLASEVVEQMVATMASLERLG